MRDHPQQILVTEGSARLGYARQALLDRITGLDAKPEYHARDQCRRSPWILANLRHGGKQEQDAGQLPSIEKGSHGNTGQGHRCEDNENIEGQHREERRTDPYLLVSQEHRKRHEIEQRKLEPLNEAGPHRPGDGRHDQVPRIHDKWQEPNRRPQERRARGVCTQP